MCCVVSEITNLEDLEYFNVEEEGNMTKVDEFNKEPNLVYIIVDHKARVIFLWKGESARIRLKFVGSRAMGDKRKEVGFHYKIDVNDQGDESKSFFKSMGEDAPESASGVTVGFAEQTDLVPSYAEAAAAQGIDVSDEEIQRTVGSERSTIGSMGGLGVKPQKSILAAMSGDGQIDDDATPVEKKTIVQVVTNIHKDSITEAIKLLSELGKPKGFEREMVVVNNHVYRSKGDESVTFEELENPLDGLFMVESYTPRQWKRYL